MGSTRALILWAQEAVFASGRATTAVRFIAALVTAQIRMPPGAAECPAVGAAIRNHSFCHTTFSMAVFPAAMTVRRPAFPAVAASLVAGTTRVWETIHGGNASFSSADWYVTNNPITQNMTKQSLGNRSFINQVKYSPKYQSVAIVGTNDGNAWIGFNLGTGTQAQANWVDVTGNNTVLPNRPVMGIALDPSVSAANLPVGYAAVGGFNANTPTTPGHIFQVTCTANCGSSTWADKTGDLPDIPVDSIIVNPNQPQQVFAGTDWGVYFTDDVSVASPTWQRFENGLPHAMVWDMQIDRGSTTLSVWTRSRGAYAFALPGGPPPSPTPTASPSATPTTLP